MSSSDALTEKLTADTLGPYILAASHIHGPATAGSLEQHLSEVVSTGVKLLVAGLPAAREGVRDMPLRSFVVTGTLSILSTNNANRTQLGVDSGQSQYGADAMWTDWEDKPAATQTRAVLQSLVGRTVTATKVTIVERDGSGAALLTDKGAAQTRTRLVPGSLALVADDGSKTPVDLAARPHATGNREKSPFVDAAATYRWLVERHGEPQVAAAWGGLPRSGEVARELANAAHRACTGPVAAAAA